MKLQIVIDSASDINKQEADKLGLIMIPMEITFGEEQYLDGVTLNSREFFEKLVETDEFPKTSQINEYRFDEVFDKLVKEGKQVLCITMSSKLSGTYNSAKAAAKKYGNNVVVVDSKNVTIGERILIQYAISLAKEGKSVEEIAKLLNNQKDKIKLLALVNTLKYLQKGGRISTLTAIAGGLLNVKPVISIEDGDVKLIGKAIGSKKGNNLLIQLVQKSGGIDFSMPFAVAYSGLSDELLQKYLEDSKGLWEGNTETVPAYLIGSTIGTHAGPGAIAVAFFAN